MKVEGEYFKNEDFEEAEEEIVEKKTKKKTYKDVERDYVMKKMDDGESASS